MERLVWGARLDGQWAYVADDEDGLARQENDVVLDHDGVTCVCGGETLSLKCTIYGEWFLECLCNRCYGIAQMPARQCRDATEAAAS